MHKRAAKAPPFHPPSADEIVKATMNELRSLKIACVTQQSGVQADVTCTTSRAADPQRRAGIALETKYEASTSSACTVAYMRTRTRTRTNAFASA